MEFNLNDLIKNAIEKSNEAILSAEFNYENKHYDTCQNRLYYSIFYLVSALAYKENFITSKHSQLIGWFNKKYIYEIKIFDEKMFAIYKEAFTNRQKSDYDFTYNPNPSDILFMLQETKYFISEIKRLLI